MKVWREGDRIRSKDGTGYADYISDAAIWQHIEDVRARKPNAFRDEDFMESVLRLRATERAGVTS